MPTDFDLIRGMLGVSMDHATRMVQIAHQDTDKTFEFHVDDLGEVIEHLIKFHNATNAGKVVGAK
jgi:hypothetical protein